MPNKLRELPKVEQSLDISPLIGGIFVICLLLLIVLTAGGGWGWVSKFLESSAPAWVQAIGSIAAIAAAIYIVNRQHSLEVARLRLQETTMRRRRLRAISTIFFCAAEICEKIAREVGNVKGGGITAYMEASKLRQARERLLSIDPLEVPDASLLLIIEKCSSRLYVCGDLVENLNTPRPENIKEMISKALMVAARDCWLGVYKSLDIDVAILAGLDVEFSQSAFSDFREELADLDNIRSRFTQNPRSANEG